MNIDARRDGKGVRNRFFAATLVAAGLALGGIADASAQGMPNDAGLTSLITETPEEGFALAVKLSQKAVAATQKDVEIRKALRPVYAHDPDSLIAVSQVVATHFQTIAAANDYWRK